MPDYREQNGTAALRTYRRFPRIVIDNPLGGLPHITVVEAEVTQIEGQEPIVRDIGNLPFAFDPATVCPLVDPDGNPTGGQITHLEIYAAIYAAVLHQAQLRDQAALGATE